MNKNSVYQDINLSFTLLVMDPKSRHIEGIKIMGFAVFKNFTKMAIFSSCATLRAAYIFDEDEILDNYLLTRNGFPLRFKNFIVIFTVSDVIVGGIICF